MRGAGLRVGSEGHGRAGAASGSEGHGGAGAAGGSEGHWGSLYPPLTSLPTPRDLVRVGVTLPGHQKKILSSAQSLQGQAKPDPAGESTGGGF